MVSYLNKDFRGLVIPFLCHSKFQITRLLVEYDSLTNENLKIPKVEFQPELPIAGEIEIFKLESLPERSSKFNFDPSTPHCIQFHCLIYVSQGVGSHYIDFNHYSYEPGSFIFVNRRQVHAFDFKNNPKGQVILFTQDFIDSIRTNIRAPLFTPRYSFSITTEFPILTVNQTLKESCENLLLEINKAGGDDCHDGYILQLLFSSLLLKLHRERYSFFESQLSEERIKKVVRFLALIEEHFANIKDATLYAHMMNMSYKSLNQLCKLATNHTPKQLIDKHTILEAKRKLAIDGMQVTQLAYELGFEEVSNFIKYFKKQTSVTPHQFKEKLMA